MTKTITADVLSTSFIAKGGCFMESSLLLNHTNVKEIATMDPNINKNNLYIIIVLDKLFKDTIDGVHSWKELSKNYMLDGRALRSDIITVEPGVEPECYEHWKDVFTYDVSLMNETNCFEEIELFHIDEDRPDTLVYEEAEDNTKGEIFYRSRYHYELCEVAGSAFSTDLDSTHKLFLLKLSLDGKMYYELYLTTLKKYELKDEDGEFANDEDADGYDPYCVTRKVEYIATSSNDAMHAKLNLLYNAAGNSAMSPHIDSGLKSLLDKLI